MAEAFNLTNAVNEIARNTTFGPARIRKPGTQLQPGHRRWRPAQLAVCAALPVLILVPPRALPRRGGRFETASGTPVTGEWRFIAAGRRIFGHAVP